MGFAIFKSFLLLFFFTIIFADEHVSVPEELATFPSHYVAVPPSQPPTSHHHHHPPVHAPTPTPVHAPTHSPVHAPAPAPHHHHHHHVHGQPPVQPPASPPHHLPSLPPSHYPPSHAPGHHHNRSVVPPAHPPAPISPPKPRLPRSFISVQGVVYCKSCKYHGVDTLLGASPLAGVTVKLVCQNTKYPLVQTGTTDKNGYFFIRASKAITTYAFHKCKVLLASSPSASCNKPSDLHGGISGAVLRPQKAYIDADKLPFVLYAVGPFAFEPTCAR